MTIKVDMPEIDQTNKMLAALLQAIEQIQSGAMRGQLWYCRADLAKLKGMPISALYHKPWLLPGPPLKQGGVEMWSYKDVFDSGWIWMSDEDLKCRIVA